MEDLDIMYGREGCQGCQGKEGFRRESAEQGPIIDGGFKESLGWEAI